MKNKLHILVTTFLVATSTQAFSQPPENGPPFVVDVEVLNTTSNPVPVVGNVNTNVSNFPATQDVSVTNTSSNPVPVTVENFSSDPMPVTLAEDDGQITSNGRIFDVPAGTTEVFGHPNFQSLNVSLLIATGMDEEVKMILGTDSSIKLVLLGNMGSGIGQEDYVISLPEPIFVDQIKVECLEASGSCKVSVEVLGKI